MAPKVEQKYVSYNGEWVTWEGVTTPPPGLQPPKFFTGEASGANNVLTWVDSTAPDETGYDIYWSTTDLTDWTTGTRLVAGLEPGRQTATHADGQSQGKVYYGISAVRGAERSGWVETSVAPPVDLYPLEYTFETDTEGWGAAVTPPLTLTWEPGGMVVAHEVGTEYAYASSPAGEIEQYAAQGLRYRVKLRATLLEWNGIGTPGLNLYASIDSSLDNISAFLDFTTVGQTLQDSSIQSMVFDTLTPRTEYLSLQSSPGGGSGITTMYAKYQVSLAALINDDGSNIEKPPSP